MEGREVPTSKYLEGISNAATKKEGNKFTGMVIDDVLAPFPSSSLDLDEETSFTPKTDFELLTSLASVSIIEKDARAKSSRFYTANAEIPDFCPIVINLTLPGSSFVRRRSSQRVDPADGKVYSGAQIKYTTMVPVEEVNLSESLEDEEAEQEDGDEAGEEDEDGIPKSALPEFFDNPINGVNYDEADIMEAEKAKIKNLPKRAKLCNKQSWEKIPEHVLPRLLTRPEDGKENVEKEESYWTETVEPYIEKLKSQATKQVLV
jgi:hypothetical protein